MKARFVIVIGLFPALLVLSGVRTAYCQTTLEKKIDSLFVIASSGEVKYRDLVEPAIEELASLGAGAVPRLIDKFDTKSARERVTLMSIMKKIGSPAVPDLTLALGRTDKLVVSRVCAALGDIKDSNAVQPLIGVCHHASWQVRDEAVDALGNIGDKRADDAVLTALRDSVGQVRKSAAVACGKLKTQESVAELIGLLGDEFYGARLMALESLMKLDSELVLEKAADSLVSANPMVGNLCCELLSRIGGDEALRLMLLQTKSPDPDRRAFAGVGIIRADTWDNCLR